MLLCTALLIGLLQVEGGPEIPATAPEAIEAPQLAQADGGVADGGKNQGLLARVSAFAGRMGVDGGTARSAAFDLADKLVSLHDSKEKEAEAAAAADAAKAPPSA